jgi:hypothetical protein
MKLRVLVATMCAVLLVTPAVFADTTSTMSVAGDVETNTTFEISDVDGGDSSNAMTNEGRTHIKFEGRTESDSGWFGAAIGDAMIDGNGSTGVDDAWVQFGTESFAFKIGRIELDSAFGKGQDTYISGAPGAPDRYQVDYTRGRFDGAINNAALDFSMGETSNLQIGLVMGNKDEEYTAKTITVTDAITNETEELQVTTSFGVNVIGVRPQFKFSSGALTAKITGEYAISMPQSDADDVKDYALNEMGGGVDLSGTFGSIEAGLAFAYGMITGTNRDNTDMADQATISSFGWAKLPVGEADTLGLGAGFTSYDADKVTTDTMIETYVSYAHSLAVEGLKVTFAGGYTMASVEPEGGSTSDNNGFGVRCRFNYDF